MDSCKSQFKYKHVFSSHLREKHGKREANILAIIEGNVFHHSEDRFSNMLSCPKCGSEWRRKYHFQRHLTMVHKMLASEATELIKQLRELVSCFYFLECYYHSHCSLCRLVDKILIMISKIQENQMDNPYRQ